MNEMDKLRISIVRAIVLSAALATLVVSVVITLNFDRFFTSKTPNVSSMIGR